MGWKLPLLAAAVSVLAAGSVSAAELGVPDGPRHRVVTKSYSGCRMVETCRGDICRTRRVCRSACPSPYSCYPLYGAYSPWGGAEYWSAYTSWRALR